MMKRILLCLAVLLTLLPISAFAQVSAVPPQMNFQGRLTRPDGTPVADTSAQTLTFRLYSALTGGAKRWEQTSAGVAVRNGTFAVRLNFASGFTSGNSLASVFNGSPAYLEIQVGSAAPLAPRQQLVSNAYAFLASSVPDGSITTNKLAPGVLNFENIGGAVFGNQIAEGTINASNLSTTLQGMLSRLNYRAPGLQGSANVATNPTFITVSGNFAYVLGNTGSFQIFDIRNPATPVLRSSTPTSAGANGSVFVIGNTAYVFSGGGTNMRKYDVSNPTVPVSLASVSLPLPVGSVVASNYVYALTQQGLFILRATDLGTVKIFDPTGALIQPRAITVMGRYIYLLYNDNRLRIVDVANPTAPVLLGTIATDANPTAIVRSGKYAYVTSAGTNTLQVFDVSNPSAPTLSGSVATGMEPSAITIARNRAFVTNKASNTLQIFDLASATSPALLTTHATNNAPAGVAFTGISAYVVNTDSSTLQIFGAYDALHMASSLSVEGAGVFSEGIFAPRADIPVLSGHLFAEGGLTASVATLPSITGATSFTDSISVAGNTSVSTLSATGSITAPSATVPQLNGNVSVGGVLSAASATLPTLNGNVNVVGTLNTGGNITAPSATLPTLNGNVTVTGTLTPNILSVSSLGIGTTTPALPLHVAVNNNTYGILIGGTISGSTNLRLGMAHSRPSIQGVAVEGVDYGTLQINPDGGNVGIGIPGQVASNYKLMVNGPVAAFGNYVNLSDARYKTNIATLPNALDAILNLRGVTYDWKKSDFPTMNFSEGRQIGFVAQEVEKILPELVTTDANGYKSVAYANVVPVLVEAVKTQQKKIDTLETKNAELEAKLNALAASIAELKEQRK
jgi:hypothetical protein